MSTPPPPPTPGAPPPPPPPEGTAVPPPPGAAGQLQWRPLEGLTTALTALLVIEVVLSILSIAASANRVSVINEILDSRSEGIQGRAEDADAFVGVVGVFYGLVALAILVLIIIWTYRAMKNNEYLGRWNARFTPGWGIAGWLIPFANLVIPVLIFQDLWRGSDPDVPRADPSWRQARGSGLIAGWWTAWVVSSLVGAGAGFNGNGESDTVDELRDLRTGDILRLGSAAVGIAAALLLIPVLRSIAARQVAVRDRVY